MTFVWSGEARSLINAPLHSTFSAMTFVRLTVIAEFYATEIEALILADIETFNFIYYTKIKAIEDVM